MDQRAELGDLGIAHPGDEPGDQTMVEATDEFGVFGRDVGERTVREGDDGGVGVLTIGDHGIEAEPVEIRHERLETGRRPVIGDRSTASFVVPDGGGILGVGTQAVGEVEHHAGEQRRGRGFEAERRGIGGQRVPVLWTADLTASGDLDIDQADVAHALEVGSHRVRVQIEGIGDLGGGAGPHRSGELEIDRIAGVVPERLQQVESRQVGGRRVVRSSIHMASVAHLSTKHGVGR